VFLPVYDQRSSSTIGWTFASVDLDALARHIDVSNDFTLRVNDVSLPGGDTPVFSVGNLESDLLITPVSLPDVEVYGRRWHATALAGAEFAAAQNLTDPADILSRGAALSLMLSALVVAFASYLKRTREVNSHQLLLASVADNASDAIIIESLQGTILSWNAAAERLFGWPARLAIGRPLADLLVPVDLVQEDADILSRCAGGAGVTAFETTRRHADGHLIDVTISAAPVELAGRVISNARYIRDNTVRKALDKSLRQNLTDLEGEVARRTASLRAVEHDLRAITDALPSLIAYWDKNLINRFANQAHRRHFDPAGKETVGLHLRDCVDASTAERMMTMIEPVMRGEPVSYEREVRDVDTNSVQTMQVHYLPDQVGDEVLGFYVLAHDISALKSTQLKLAASERILEESADRLRTVNDRFSIAAEAAGIGVFEWDLANKELWDDQMYRLYEADPARLEEPYFLWANSLHPDDRVRVEREIDKASVQGEKWDTEFRIKLPCGAYRHIKAAAQVQRDSAGKAVRMIGVNFDISDRKVAEQALIESEFKFRALFELSPVGIALNDALTGAFLSVNAALTASTGYSEREMLGMTYWDLTPPRLKDQEVAATESLRLNGRYGPYEKAHLRKDGSEYPVLQSGIRTYDANGRDVIWSIIQDISLRKEMETKLTDAASRDKLTGLANRTVFMDRLEKAVARVQAGHQARFAVLFLDFDRFKQVNDTLGHDAGDELMRQISKRLRSVLRASDALLADDTGNVVSRFGGDEFLLLINDLSSPQGAEAIGERLLNALSPVYDIHGTAVRSSASIGIVTSEQCQTTAEDIIRNADVAMYEAKRAGRACFVVFNDAMHVRLTRHMTIESGLRHALEAGELYLEYQPIVDLATGAMVSAEALVRWIHPTLGRIAPSEFIPIAEESELIIAVGQWVQKEACQAMAKWRHEDANRAPATVSVNISRAELAIGERLLHQVRDTLEYTGLPGHCLQLEVTEREIMRNPDASRTLMRQLQTLGVKIAMDDFGSGTSSLGVLRDYPFDAIKIDRSFVQDLCTSDDVMALMHATINLIENLGMGSVAEGVEDSSQAGILQSMGCRYAQGHLFSHPVGADELLGALHSRASRSAAPMVLAAAEREAS
jgi:diguanylate cyclase (GGDEF)-like protein/PAS domain S-box-containing protein